MRYLTNRRLPVTSIVVLLLLGGCGGDDATQPRAASVTPEATVSDAAPQPEETPEPPPQVSGVDVTRIELPYEGGSIAFGGGAVWSVPHKDRAALRIDASSADVTNQIDLPGVGAEVAANRDMVWASISKPADFTPIGLVRIDPKTRRVVARVKIPAVFPKIASGRVWAAGVDGRLYAIDPRTNRVVRKIRTGTEAFGYVVSGPYAWIARPGELKQVDTASGRVTDFSRLVRGLPEGYEGSEELSPVLARKGRVWAVGARQLVAIDASSGDVQARIRGPKGTTLLPDAVMHDTDLWLFAFGEGDAIMRLLRVDPERRRIVKRFRIDTFPESGFAAGAGYIWVPEAAQPSLLRLEP